MARYSLQQRPIGDKYSRIEDGAFRSRCISIASTGISRRHVAELCGVPKSTLCGWVERGMAHPEVEPWGSFSEDYRRAEAGIAGSIGRTTAMRMVVLEEQMVVYAKWQRTRQGDMPYCPSIAEMEWLARMREQRWPDEYGASKHRKPEPEMSADRWLEQNALTHEQLMAMWRDPPEVIKKSLQAEAPSVYRILVEGGFDPFATVERKAET